MSLNDKYTRDEDKRFTLRINKELFKKVEASAKAHKRAIGREIEYLLELELSDKKFVTKQEAIEAIKYLNSQAKSKSDFINIDEIDISGLYSRDDL